MRYYHPPYTPKFGPGVWEAGVQRIPAHLPGRKCDYRKQNSPCMTESCRYRKLTSKKRPTSLGPIENTTVCSQGHDGIGDVCIDFGLCKFLPLYSTTWKAPTPLIIGVPGYPNSWLRLLGIRVSGRAAPSRTPWHSKARRCAGIPRSSKTDLAWLHGICNGP